MHAMRRWLGSLLAPAEDPRRGAAPSTSTPQLDVLLDDLRRARAELAQLREQIEGRASHSAVAEQLADEERELAEAESALLLQVDEERARAALIRATEARIKAL